MRYSSTYAKYMKVYAPLGRCPGARGGEATLSPHSSHVERCRNNFEATHASQEARRVSTHPRSVAKSNSNIGEPHAQRATRGTSSSESQTPTTIPLRYHLKILTRARRPPSGHLRARGISARADQRSLERRITHAGSSEIEIEPLPIGNGIEIEISPSGITHNPKTQSITVDL